MVKWPIAPLVLRRCDPLAAISSGVSLRETYLRQVPGGFLDYIRDQGAVNLLTHTDETCYKMDPSGSTFRSSPFH